MIFKTLLIFVFSFTAFADMGQNLPYQIEDSPLEELKAEMEGVDGFIPEMGQEEEQEILKSKKKKGVIGLPDDESDYLSTPGAISTSPVGVGNMTPGIYEDEENYLENSNERFSRKIMDMGKTGFELSYIVNDYDFEGKNDVFNRTYDSGGPKDRRGGTIHMGFNNFFHRGFFDLAYGYNIGVGFSSGRGVFVGSQEKSDARVDLWQIPFDLSGTVEMNISRYIKLAASVGPSVMFLMQVRDDRDNGEKGKRRRQVGYGYFGSVKFKISLSEMFSSNSFALMRDSAVSRYYLNLEARTQNYDNFQDEIKITGNSFGLGFSFEFL
jgi:hypothetical protein